MNANLKKPLIFGCGLIFLGGLLYFISEYIEPVYPLLTKRYQQLMDQQNELEYISIGSSHSVALDYAAMGIKGYHLWDYGEDLFESAFKMKYILDDLPRLNTVFLTLPYQIFVHDNAYAEIGNQYRNRTKLYYITDHFELINQDVGALVKGKLAPIARYDHWVFLPKYLIQRQGEIIPVKETLSIELLTENGNMRGEAAGFEKHDALNEVALLKLQEHLRYMSQTRERVINIEDKTFTALTEIVTLCSARNINLILYTPPFYRSYLDSFPEDVLANFNHRMKQLKASGATYLDYSSHPNFVNVPQYFQDGNHLSSEGAKRFSKLLAKDLDLANN